jgi:[acyl-carrier-protein] S-malonyltransferase
MSLAILCSGQGPQDSRMFALTGDAPAATPLFARAAALLDGRDPRDMAQSDTSATLHRNRTGQILCTLQALAATAALRDALPRTLLVAGYSVGEVAAWSVGGLIDATATLDLVARRAEAMDAASAPGDGLLFVRGLPLATMEALCKRRGASIAIVNPNGAYVIGGSGAELDAFADDAKASGAVRVVRIAVNVAAHTPRLAAASIAFRRTLGEAPLRRMHDRNIRLFSGVDGAAVLDIDSGIDKLAEQISRPVQWESCLQSCVEAGATAFLELGPGRALSDMAANAYPHVAARSLADFRTLDGVRGWLARC